MIFVILRIDKDLIFLSFCSCGSFGILIKTFTNVSLVKHVDFDFVFYKEFFGRYSQLHFDLWITLHRRNNYYYNSFNNYHR